MQPRSTAQIAAAGAVGRPTLVGSVPPDFTGKPINRDQSLTLSDQFGKVVAIEFWATWCGPCMAVMPELKKLHEKYKDSDDVVIVTVSLDQDAESLKEVMEQQGIEFPVIYEGRDQSQAIADAFGLRGIPSSFVIGRDGRFAADMMHGSQLAAAVEAAVAKPLDPAFAEGVKPARLAVSLSLDDDKSGVPGATIKLTAVNGAGGVVREETIHPPGQARQFTWLYPPLADGGQLRVTVAAEGLAEQEKTVSSPGEKAEVAFAFASPRTISGSIAVDDATPVPDMKVTALRNDGLRRNSVSDADGKFRLAVMPGTYWLVFEGSDDFAPIAGEREQVVVGVDSDPSPVELAACRTVTVSGTVFDEDWQPVADAEVRAGPSSKKAITDESGRFELGGVPSRGAVQIYAVKRPKFAMATLQDCEGWEPLTLVLGERQPGREGLTAGAKIPLLVLHSLDDGAAHDWQPAAEGDSLIVFCALWHPAGRELVERAKTWADEHDATLTVASIDWSLAAARRAAAALNERQSRQCEILFAGPGGLEIDKAWSVAPPAQAYLVSSGGKVRKAPRPGALP
jgi:thiol-disulfide isomerase/thioredoxin